MRPEQGKKDKQKERQPDLRPRVHRALQAQSARFDERAFGGVGEHHFQHSARKRKHGGGGENAEKQFVAKIRERTVKNKPCTGEKGGAGGEFFGREPVDEKEEKGIRRQLCAKPRGGEDPQLHICKSVQPCKGYEQNGGDVGNDRLVDDARAADAGGIPVHHSCFSFALYLYILCRGKILRE